jgi:DNA (cytosine-5)-methyltransferase 1
MTTERPTAVDLFCGAGGLSTGLQWAGFDIAWATDHNADACETYQENHPDVECLTGDVRELEFPATDEPVDLVVGGPPCPTFSLVGRSKLNSLEGRNAATDERTQLWKRLLAAVKYYSPQAFVMENVAGMRSAMNDVGEPVLRHIETAFRECEYIVRSQVINAADFGVPQERERLFIIGVREELGRPPDLEKWRTHREPENWNTHRPRFISQSERDSDQQTLGEFGIITPDSESEIKPTSRRPWVTVAEAISELPPLSPAGDNSGSPHPPTANNRYVLHPVTEYQVWARRNVPVDEETGEELLQNHEARYHNVVDLSIYAMLGEGTGWRIGDLPSEVQPYRSDVFSDNYTKQRPDRPSSTVTAHIQKDGHMYIHPHEARSFTVREAARLQSFPDRFGFPVSRTAAYRQVGNAVPPLLAEGIGKALFATLEGY